MILIRKLQRNTNCRIKTITVTSKNKTFHSICYGSCRLRGRPVCVCVCMFYYTRLFLFLLYDKDSQIQSPLGSRELLRRRLFSNHRREFHLGAEVFLHNADKY
jgi:hypothetical protein